MSRTATRKKREYAPIVPATGRTVSDAEFLRGDEGVDAERRVRAINAQRAGGLMLADMRARKGLTQAQFAEKAGWTQSRVSRLESAGMDGVSLADLSAYSSHCSPMLMILGKTNIADRIKVLSEALIGQCDALAKLADGDKAITDGAHELIRTLRDRILQKTDTHLKATTRRDKSSDQLLIFPASASSKSAAALAQA